MTNVVVKWAGQKYDVVADFDDSPQLFKAQLYALTGVPPERQKVLAKGRTIGDESWNGLKLPAGSMVMMLGSVEAVPQAIVPSASDHGNEGGKKVVMLPAGLKNLGNTCYMNATLQSFRVIPELMDAIKDYQGSAQSHDAERYHQMTSAIKGLFSNMIAAKREEDGSASVIPFIALQALHTTFPQFNARDNQGHMMQQDANECFSELLRLLLTQLSRSAPEACKKITQYLEGRMTHTLKCIEAENEPVQTSEERFVQLSCYLSQEVKYLQLGIKNKMTEELEKESPVLQRNAKYEKKSMISRLPAYLSVQMVRFFYKEKDQICAKILKDVKFPMVLDVFDMCSPELQTKLLPMREQFKEFEDKKVEQLRLSKLNADSGAAEAMETDESKEREIIPSSFSDDEGSNNSGFYELKAVITHKGRSSNSGHYVAWVRMDEEKWAKCDDDEISFVTGEEVLKLSGGGDWHCAYVLVYGPRTLYKL
ncbi:hypothetical protein QR680_004845 [Steinernema hermaphroditum]|uniref:Ubiquitin carboxyl-terminal hydrolase n=1 Tax=Steinernema hermaphroditum TaxID=289476 RepID=A0AA39HS88_9BILA|nr:hypothetical protein QR680_004845 [Steinernema hermaphroditum]